MVTGQMLYEKLLEARPISKHIPAPAAYKDLLTVAQIAYEGLAKYVNELIKGEK